VGCATETAGVPKTVAVEQDDIPYPENFAFEADRSFSVAPAVAVPAGRYRSWRGFYRGEGDQGVVLSWYMQEMPKYGWKLKNADTRDKKLYFEKKDEFAEIELVREIDQDLGKYVNIVKATIRPLGPENFTVDENIGRLRQGASPQPAGYSKKDGDAASGSMTPAVAPGTNAQGRENAEGQVSPSATNPKVLEEVDRIDREYE
jgi:hypothetical protein